MLITIPASAASTDVYYRSVGNISDISPATITYYISDGKFTNVSSDTISFSFIDNGNDILASYDPVEEQWVFEKTMPELFFTTFSTSSSTFATESLNGGDFTAEDLVNMLLGKGSDFVVSNITLTGNNQAIGRFFNGNAFGFDSGLVMSTGNVSEIPEGGNPNFNFGLAGDSDLDQLAGASPGYTKDAIVLEFDFITDASAITFNYRFATKEALGASFNDPFGLFINGENVAFLPNNKIVSVTNLVGEFAEPQPFNSGTSIPGFSIPLTAVFEVEPHTLNRMKFAIADGGDDVVDSVVFIEGESFVTNVPPNAPTSTLCEGEINPTNVNTLTPTFSWVFYDSDDGDEQTAYQIQVGTVEGSSDMWDSGKVLSSTSQVVYGGSELSWGTTYYWRVKTWDNNNVVGPFNPYHNFTIAEYQINEYTVTFKDHDGTTLKTETVTHGSSATAPAHPERDGFEFTGWDTYFSNVVSDMTVTANYTDILSPVIHDILYPENVNTDQSFTIAFNVTDNIAINDFDLNISTDDTAALTQNGNWFNATFTAPVGSLDDIVFNASFYDAAGNLNSTGDLMITVADSIAPVIEDIEYPEYANNDESVKIVFYVTDNIAVHSFDLNLSTDDTATLTQNGNWYNYTFNVPLGSLDDIVFNATFYDAAGNLNSTEDLFIAVSDNIVPVIHNNSITPSSAMTNELVSISFNASDNIGIASAVLEISTQAAPIDLSANGNWYNYSFTTPHTAGKISYSALFTDAAGNNISSGLYTIDVRAPDRNRRTYVGESMPPEVVGSTHSGINKVVAGSSVKYDFSQDNGPVISISFDAKDSKGNVVGTVQVLKDKPDNTDAPASNPYRFMSINLGTKGTISTSSADNIMIEFKVDREWINENNIDVDTIRIARYHNDQWQDLPSNKVGEDDDFLYFTATTPGFSLFSIMGDKITTENPKAEEPVPSQYLAKEATDEKGFELPIFGGIILVSLLAGIVLFLKGKNEDK